MSRMTVSIYSFWTPLLSVLDLGPVMTWRCLPVTVAEAPRRLSVDITVTLASLQLVGHA